jgi:hypothetical protein
MDNCFKPATQCTSSAPRMTAAERQFERFISAVQQFDCDDSTSRFEETLAKLVAAGPVSSRRAALDRQSDALRVRSDTRNPRHVAEPRRF